MNVLTVCSEISPCSKTGGLADVSGSLPSALAEKGCLCTVIAPYYKETRKKGVQVVDTGIRVSVPIGDKTVQATILKCQDAPFPLYFIDQPIYFNRDSIYGGREGDYPDNWERFTFFCRAALETAATLDFKPDVIHCHDWQTGLIPAYLKTIYKGHEAFKSSSTVFTIHNLAYQGNFDASLYPLTGLPQEIFHPGGIEFYSQFSFLKAGLVYSDFITTVSETYSREILTKEFGCGMEGVLTDRADSLTGIVNGINLNEWNPARDNLIARPFSCRHPGGKRASKLDLLNSFSLQVSKVAPIIAMVSRLTSQKGVDIVMETMDHIMESKAAFVLLGSGDAEYEKFFIGIPRKYPGRVGVEIRFDEKLAHKIYAGADLFLMPSRFEPCGLSQMIAMRYGTVPIVRAVGGLSDTVPPYDPVTESGSGFIFKEPGAEGLAKAVDQALNAFRDKRPWNRLVKRIMEKDNSWDRSAEEYVKLYNNLISEKVY